MTSQQVNDELMSRRVCNYQYGMVFYPITPGTGAPCHYTSYNTWLSPSFLLYIQLLFSIAIATAGITIIPNSHLNGLDSSRQGTTRNGCTLNRACVGPAKLRSTEIAENRISGKNAKSLWLARLGYSNLPVKIFARGQSGKTSFHRDSRVMAGQKSSLSGPVKARTRQPGFLLLFFSFFPLSFPIC
ncbi:uncharacterized protein N7525_006604 [Penicillium rubens]|uniref:uncharacterized protein n=1 Tax=Penicillium rubens TaxID=1108849 RepID=UPI002A59BBFF|nr:uncharacterized protein N7525_006604 [Penicillium rubens]KAJ5828351.1 hypothetical protein N7525_006604 [Penicillium rubens]